MSKSEKLLEGAQEKYQYRLWYCMDCGGKLFFSISYSTYMVLYLFLTKASEKSDSNVFHQPVQIWISNFRFTERALVTGLASPSQIRSICSGLLCGRRLICPCSSWRKVPWFNDDSILCREQILITCFRFFEYYGNTSSGITYYHLLIVCSF